jgi:hypothetical protein
MKFIALILVLMSVTACKVDDQNSQNSAPTTLENKDQVVISGNNLNSEEVLRFSEELEQKQIENPDTFFEVVKSSNNKVILSNLSDDALYPKKNFYFLIGLGETDKDNRIQKTDWDAVYYIMNYLAEQKYRVLVNVRATAEHLRLASQDKDTSVILWSSHGNENGFYDVDKIRVPYDIFKNKHKNFYQFILSSCEGRIALDSNYSITALKTFAWTGITNSSELKSFLVSDSWTSNYGRSLITPIGGITCTEKEKKIILMKENTRKDLYGYGFNNLDECNSRVKTIKNNRVCSKGEAGVFEIDINTLDKVQEYNSLEECLQR